MGRVAKYGIKRLELDQIHIPVTFLAVALHRKGGLAIVTGAARYAVLHIAHGRIGTSRSCHKKLAMAVCATIRQVQVQLMTEYGFACHAHIFHLVAFAAVFLDRKRCCAVMTGATAFTSFHLSHAIMLVVSAGAEQGVVAVSAGKRPKVLVVTEDQGTEIRDGNGDVTNLMAPDAIFQLRGAGIRLVVTGTAGFSLLHICHGVNGVFLEDDMKYRIVAA